MTAEIATAIEANVAAVRGRIAAACERSGRHPDMVTLVAVSKGMPARAVRAVIGAGVTAIGENYVQEAVPKRADLATDGDHVEWHLLGHLQSNKVSAALGAFDVIESVDSVRIAEAIDSRTSRQVPVLIEVNVAGEASKSGFAPGDVAAAVKHLAKLPNLDLRGLMTTAPAAANGEETRACFRTLSRLAGDHGLQHLSMGMTGDFEVAIEEGSTMVRIGRAIFGERRA
jgi:pyridoxal phosphate enzyme (YggS family)